MNNMAGTDADEFQEITLDVQDDKLVASVKTVAGGGEDPNVTLLEGTREKRQLSSRFKHFGQEVRRVASMSRRRTGSGHIDRSKSTTAHALQGLRFIGRDEGGTERLAIERRFDELAKDGLLHRSQFGECIGNGMEELDFAAVLFDALARRAHISRDSISKEELVEFLDHVSNTSFDSRLLTFFDMVDKDADGRITEGEIKEIITLSASANKLSKVRNKAEEYARLVMEELDPNGFGYIELHSLKTLLLQEPSQSTHSRIRSQPLSQKKSSTDPNSLRLRQWYRRASCFLEENWRRVWVMLLWLSICVALFTWKFTQYRRRAVFQVMGYCVCVAKGGAETLKFNMALILLPVCRNTITWIRDRTAVGRAVPFDDSLSFHQVVAAGVSVGAGLHVISHLACDFPRLLQTTPAEYAPMIPFFGEKKPPNYWWFVKGTEGWTGLVMLLLMAIVFILATPWFRRSLIPLFPVTEIPNRPLNEHYQRAKRRNECNELLNQPIKWLNDRTGFNVFWYSHHLMVIVYALLIVHGHFLYLTHSWYKKSTWMYLAVPVLLYACERLTRALRSRGWKTVIVKANVYPGPDDATTKQVIPVESSLPVQEKPVPVQEKPAEINGKKNPPGPTLSMHFSKPTGFRCKSGQYIFVHCADVSPFQWHPFSITSAPQDDYVGVHIRALGDWTREINKVFSEALEQAKTDGAMNKPRFPTVRIDGPYGAPSQDYKQYEVVLLVGLGIGATPMISILKDIINDTKQPETGASGRCRRAYFYWSTREEGSFDWFNQVMDEVAESDKKRVIELHNHCTSVYKEGDARSALITMLQSLNRAKGGVDVVSGTHVETHFGRPNWREVYKRIALNHKGQRVGVFYCGAPLLTKELRELAQDFSMKTDTKFEFHKENF